jgi:hypothetical protein
VEPYKNIKWGGEEKKTKLGPKYRKSWTVPGIK